jgi:hypothetical protein
MEGLTYGEMTALTDSTLDSYASRLLMAQTIHKKINTTSVGKLSFEKWASITSFFDLETLVYGIYLETFPGDTKFDITCGHCKKKIVANVNNDSLITTKDAVTTEKVNEILSSGNNVEQVKNNVLSRATRIVLPYSKIIVDLKMPSVAKHLELLSGVKPENEKKLARIIMLMLYIDNMYVMDINGSMKSHKSKYFQVSDKNQIGRIIDKMTAADARVLLEEIGKLSTTYSVEYGIKSFECPNCHKPVGDIPVDMENLLFIQILPLVE